MRGYLIAAAVAIVAAGAWWYQRTAPDSRVTARGESPRPTATLPAPQPSQRPPTASRRAPGPSTTDAPSAGRAIIAAAPCPLIDSTGTSTHDPRNAIDLGAVILETTEHRCVAISVRHQECPRSHNL